MSFIFKFQYYDFQKKFKLIVQTSYKASDYYFSSLFGILKLKFSFFNIMNIGIFTYMNEYYIQIKKFCAKDRKIPL